MYTKKISIIIAILIMALPSMALAQGGPAGRWWCTPNLSGQLNLTDQEKTKLDSLYQANRTRLIDMRAAVEKEQVALEDLMSKDPLNEAQITAQYKRLDKARATMAEERFKYFLEVRKILGADRFQKLSMNAQAYHRGRGGRMGGMSWR